MIDIVKMFRAKSDQGWTPRDYTFVLSTAEGAPAAMDHLVPSGALLPSAEDAHRWGVDGYALYARLVAGLDGVAHCMREAGRDDAAGLVNKLGAEVMVLSVILYVIDHMLRWPAAWDEEMPTAPQLMRTVPGAWVVRAFRLRATILLQQLASSNDLATFQVCADKGFFAPEQLHWLVQQSAAGSSGARAAQQEAPVDDDKPRSGRSIAFAEEAVAKKAKLAHEQEEAERTKNGQVRAVTMWQNYAAALQT